MYIKRTLEKVIKERLFQGKVIILYGPRQAGKTTMVKHLLSEVEGPIRFIDCELLENKALLTNGRSSDLFSLVRQYALVVFDEAQVIPNIGSVLKSIHDHHPEVQCLATGSSSFDLANTVSEPLTGRSFEFILYPFSITELASTAFDAEHLLPEFLRFGGYPDVYSVREEEKIFRLKTLVSQYLYKNVLSVGGIKKPEIMTRLVTLLAHQIGNEVSYSELARQLGTSQQTVDRYIDILEKNFILFRLGAFAKNMRNEVVRSKKIYFVDPGLRNALIDSFLPIDPVGRGDVGALFENVMTVERIKHAAHTGNIFRNGYFWRTFSGQEVDYVEATSEAIKGYEYKWNLGKKRSAPRSFLSAYPQATVTTITPRETFAFVFGEI